MITVTLFRENGNVVKVRASGHSGLAENGSDVLCAAVSALVQTAYLAVCDMGVKASYKRDDANGYFEFDIPKCDSRHDVDVVIRAMCVGLEDISGGYPQNLRLEEA